MGRSEKLVNGRKSLVLEKPAAASLWTLARVDWRLFPLQGQRTDPLHWATPALGETSIPRLWPFLCLDRWGHRRGPKVQRNALPW